jgi:hypothetical protein
MRKVNGVMAEHLSEPIVGANLDPNYNQKLHQQSVEKARKDTSKSEGIASQGIIVTPAPKQM